MVRVPSLRCCHHVIDVGAPIAAPVAIRAPSIDVLHVQLAESMADAAARRPRVHGLGLERGADTDSDAEEWDRHEAGHPAHDNTAVWTHTDEVRALAGPRRGLLSEPRFGFSNIRLLLLLAAVE
jgi:hypothetical protein